MDSTSLSSSFYGSEGNLIDKLLERIDYFENVDDLVNFLYSFLFRLIVLSFPFLFYMFKSEVKSCAYFSSRFRHQAI